ncbi:MAG: chromosome segregation ATPase [Lysobacterales bacterium]|jgi:chromosome segregation ATPase
MSKAAKRNLIILMILLLASLGFAGYIVLEKGKLEKKVLFLDGELLKADKREKKSLQKIGSLQKDVTTVTGKKAAVEKKLKSTEGKLLSKETDVKDLKSKINKASAANKKVERRMEIALQQRDKLTKELASEKSKKAKVPEVKIVYRDRPESDKTPVKSNKRKVELSGDASTDEYWASVLKQKAELQVQLDTVKDEFSTISLEIVELKQANADLQIELDDFQHNKGEIEREIKYKSDLVNNLSLELARAKNDKKFVADRVDQLNQENGTLRKELKKLVSVKGSLEKSIIRLAGDKKVMSKKLEQTDSLIQSKIDEIWDIKDSLDQNFKSSRTTVQSNEIELPPIVVNSSGGGLDKAAVAFNLDQTTPGFDGRVVSMNEDNNFVIVDIGESEGIRLGDMISVYRDSKYIARLEVIQVRKDISAADIKDQWSRVQVGDIIR